jgi:hypothetical protein
LTALDALSVILGFIDEYQGHLYEADGELIESFYPAEGKQAESFREWLAVFAAERGISASIRSEKRESGHIDILCRELAFLISQSYRVRRRSPYFPIDHQGESCFSREVYELYISEEVFAHAGMREKISFLIGAYVRFGKDNTYVFANAEHKVRLSMSLLEQVGCTNINLSTNPDDHIPRVSTISFTPSAALAGGVAQLIKFLSTINTTNRQH